MMKSITKQKPFDEVEMLIEKFNHYLIGCGTCATMTKTGGINEVRV